MNNPCHARGPAIKRWVHELSYLCEWVCLRAPIRVFLAFIFVFMTLCTCVFEYKCVFVYVCICTYVYVCICIRELSVGVFVCTCKKMSVYGSACMCLHASKCMQIIMFRWVCAFSFAFICVCISMCVSMCMCTHVLYVCKLLCKRACDVWACLCSKWFVCVCVPGWTCMWDVSVNGCVCVEC